MRLKRKFKNKPIIDSNYFLREISQKQSRKILFPFQRSQESVIDCFIKITHPTLPTHDRLSRRTSTQVKRFSQAIRNHLLEAVSRPEKHLARLSVTNRHFGASSVHSFLHNLDPVQNERGDSHQTFTLALMTSFRKKQLEPVPESGGCLWLGHLLNFRGSLGASLFPHRLSESALKFQAFLDASSMGVRPLVLA